MVIRRLLAAMRTSITAKVCFFVLVTGVALFALLGPWYLKLYDEELERGLAVRMALPATLMSQMAMNFEAVADLPSLEHVVGDRVVEAFVARKDGPVFYASDPGKVGKDWADLVPAAGREPSRGALPAAPRLLRTREAGRRLFALLAPIQVGGEAVGLLYLKVDAESVVRRERAVALRFAAGGALSIALVVLIAGFWVQRLLVPRISRTVAVLRDVEAGRLSSRIGAHGSPDQIGALMQSVDAMIEQVDARSRGLQTLAAAAEQLANAEDRDAVRATLAANAAAGEGEPGGEAFAQTLRRLETDALRRVDALADLRRAEKEYRDLFANAVEGIFRESADGRMLAANPALARMLGYHSAEEFLERFPEFVEWSREFVGDWSEFLERVRTGGEARDVEVRCRRRDGEVVLLALSGRAITGPDGELAAVEGSAVDISDRKRREVAEAERLAAEAAGRATAEMLAVLGDKNRQLESALKELRQAQERLVQQEKMAAMGTMAAGVAHDLNNILSGIVGYPDLLLQQLPAGSPWREGLEVIRESGMRAAAVVADLLTIARGAAYPTAPTDLNRLVERHLQSPEHRHLLARFPDVRVRTDLAAGLRPAECSDVHLRKVLMNLVMNACEAIRDAGEVLVSTANRTVSPADELARTLPPGDYVALAVSDTGPGIPAGDLARVFEPFFSKKILGRSGTGLGLAVVWNTVQEHHGAVTAESGESGARFTVLLPACVAGTAEPAPSRAPQAGALERLRGSASVLVVDDEERLRLLAVRALGALGYRAEAVPSGEEALERLRGRAYDLVLLDMIMPPGMNGAETWREIVKIRPGQRAVICSGYALSEDFVASRREGAGAFLQKPYTIEELGEAVCRELERPA